MEKQSTEGLASSKKKGSGVAAKTSKKGASSSRAGVLINSLLKKHNSIIHIEGSLSLLEKKLYNVLLLNAYDELSVSRLHTIPVFMLTELLGFNSHNIEYLGNSIKHLQSTILEVNLLKDGKREWEAMTLLSYAKIANGICSYRYDEALAERLKTPEIYTSINISVQRQFNSTYAISLYENCVRFRDVGATGLWEIDLLRLMLGAHNSPNYKSFKEFNRACIKPAIQEINELSDIYIEPFFEREGRSITKVKFTVTKKQQQNLIAADIDDPQAKIRQSSGYIKLRTYGLPDHLATLYLTTSAERTEQALKQMEMEQAKLTTRGKRPTEFLKALIESGVDLSQEAEKVKQEVIEFQRQLAKQSNDSRLEIQRNTEQASMINQSISNLSPNELKALYAEFCVSKGQEIDVGADGYPSDNWQKKLFTLWLRGRLSASWVEN